MQRRMELKRKYQHHRRHHPLGYYNNNNNPVLQKSDKINWSQVENCPTYSYIQSLINGQLRHCAAMMQLVLQTQRVLTKVIAEI
jgi:hypothetical protein